MTGRMPGGHPVCGPLATARVLPEKGPPSAASSPRGRPAGSPAPAAVAPQPTPARAAPRRAGPSRSRAPAFPAARRSSAASAAARAAPRPRARDLLTAAGIDVEGEGAHRGNRQRDHRIHRHPPGRRRRPTMKSQPSSRPAGEARRPDVGVDRRCQRAGRRPRLATPEIAKDPRVSVVARPDPGPAPARNRPRTGAPCRLRGGRRPVAPVVAGHPQRAHDHQGSALGRRSVR